MAKQIWSNHKLSTRAYQVTGDRLPISKEFCWSSFGGPYEIVIKGTEDSLLSTFTALYYYNTYLVCSMNNRHFPFLLLWGTSVRGRSQVATLSVYNGLPYKSTHICPFSPDPSLRILPWQLRCITAKNCGEPKMSPVKFDQSTESYKLLYSFPTG